MIEEKKKAIQKIKLIPGIASFVSLDSDEKIQNDDIDKSLSMEQDDDGFVFTLAISVYDSVRVKAVCKEINQVIKNVFWKQKIKKINIFIKGIQ